VHRCSLVCVQREFGFLLEGRGVLVDDVRVRAVGRQAELPAMPQLGQAPGGFLSVGSATPSPLQRGKRDPTTSCHLLISYSHTVHMRCFKSPSFLKHTHTHTHTHNGPLPPPSLSVTRLQVPSQPLLPPLRRILRPGAGSPPPSTSSRPSPQAMQLPAQPSS
jgi:hypothetical protein